MPTNFYRLRKRIERNQIAIKITGVGQVGISVEEIDAIAATIFERAHSGFFPILQPVNNLGIGCRYQKSDSACR